MFAFRLACAVVAVAGLTVGGALAATTPMSQSASIVAASPTAGARPVKLTLQLHYEMQCGNPGTGFVRVKLPASAQLPATLPAGSALLNGKRVTPTLIAGKALRVTLPPRPGVMCDEIGPGTLTLVFTKAANIGNPAKAGTYAVSASSNRLAFSTTLRITG